MPATPAATVPHRDWSSGVSSLWRFIHGPHAEAHPSGFPTKGRWLDRIERNIEGGKPEAVRAG